MGFPNCKAYQIKIWETPEGEWTAYFIEEKTEDYLFFLKKPSFGELLMGILIEGYKHVKDKK